MARSLKSKRLTIFLAVVMLIGCMAAPALAYDPLTAVEIWQPQTPYQATSPNTVYMDYDDIDNWTIDGEHMEKIAWKTLSGSWNPDILDDGLCRAACYKDNDGDKALVYSYTFDAGNIKQELVEQQPYYLGIKTTASGSGYELDLGCRTVFPVPMIITVPTDLAGAVTVSYVPGSCDGYDGCQATSWSELQDDSYGDSDYLDNHPYLGTFFNKFTTYNTTTDANGYVTFTTGHGGEYEITYQ